MSKHKHHKKVSETQGNTQNFNLGSIAEAVNSINLDGISAVLNAENNNEKEDEKVNTDRNEIISAIKTLLRADKTELIKVFMELYAAGKNSKK